MWRELDIRAMTSFQFRPPSLDLGCGDGVFSFIRAGGVFAPDFDALDEAVALDRFFENVDVFDAPVGARKPLVALAPSYRVDVGFDAKPNLLEKAARLDFYRRLHGGNANQPLPFEARSFNTVFSNILYWLEDPGAALTEIARVLRDGGQACVMLPNETFPRFSYYSQLYVSTGDPAWQFLTQLDRGRFTDNVRHARAGAAWEALFATAGLRVLSHTQHLSKTIVQMWDIGLRPLFPVLRRLADGVAPGARASIKAEWVAILQQFLAPIVAMDARLGQGAAPAFHCYVLGK